MSLTVGNALNLDNVFAVINITPRIYDARLTAYGPWSSYFPLQALKTNSLDDKFRFRDRKDNLLLMRRC